jgi:hypothetical protein
VLQSVLSFNRGKWGERVDWLADIVRLLDMPLSMIALGATPIHLPVVAFSWSVLPRPSNPPDGLAAGEAD